MTPDPHAPAAALCLSYGPMDNIKNGVGRLRESLLSLR
jgi:hypothetical protein